MREREKREKGRCCVGLVYVLEFVKEYDSERKPKQLLFVLINI